MRFIIYKDIQDNSIAEVSSLPDRIGKTPICSYYVSRKRSSTSDESLMCTVKTLSVTSCRRAVRSPAAKALLICIIRLEPKSKT